MDGFAFGAPGYLFLLALVPLFLLLVAVLRRRPARFTVAFTNVDVLAEVVARRRRHVPRRRLPFVLLSLALAALALALAQPRIVLPNPTRTTTVILLVDVSESMKALDVHPSRLTAAVLAMHDFVHVLPAADKVGLVTFSDKVEVLADPTTDHPEIAEKLELLTPQGGTALGEGVEAAVRLLVSSLAADGISHKPGQYLPAAIVLESDGAQNRGNVTPFRSAQLAAAAGVRIYGVALGKQGGFIPVGQGFYELKIPVPPSPATVGLLARESGGKAFSATNSTRLDTIYRQLGTTIGNQSSPTSITSWFEIAAALLFVAGLIVARVRGGALP
jgi:Ca-activated chloride channel family protein